MRPTQSNGWGDWWRWKVVEEELTRAGLSSNQLPQNWPWTSMGSFPGPSLKPDSKKPFPFWPVPHIQDLLFSKFLGDFLSLIWPWPKCLVLSLEVFPFLQPNWTKGPWIKNVFLTFSPQIKCWHPKSSGVNQISNILSYGSLNVENSCV